MCLTLASNLGPLKADVQGSHGEESASSEGSVQLFSPSVPEEALVPEQLSLNLWSPVPDFRGPQVPCVGCSSSRRKKGWPICISPFCSSLPPHSPSLGTEGLGLLPPATSVSPGVTCRLPPAPGNLLTNVPTGQVRDQPVLTQKRFLRLLGAVTGVPLSLYPPPILCEHPSRLCPSWSQRGGLLVGVDSRWGTPSPSCLSLKHLPTPAPSSPGLTNAST